MKLLENYSMNMNDSEIKCAVEDIQKSIPKADREELQQIFSCIDLTSLNSDDTYEKIRSMVQKVNEFPDHFGFNNVAAICIYPPFVQLLKKELSAENVSIASVGGCFPSSQSFLETKIVECKQVATAGANEIDIVISIGKFLSYDYETVFQEIKLIKEAIGDVHLKVILETGALKNYQQIYEASILAMEAGADFVKTSTGKMEPAATPDAIYVMAKAVKDFHEKTNKKIGVKPAGGIATIEDAQIYYHIIKEVLGTDWLNNNLFRIGASRLANNVLSELLATETKYF